MAKFNVYKCPVCTGTTFKSFLTCTDFFVSKEEFKIKECITCGLKITEEVDDDSTIGHYYQSDEYISHSNTSKGIVNFLYHHIRNFTLSRKRRLVQATTGLRRGNILDVGTGTAFFLNHMNLHGWRVTGIEKSSVARQFAKSEFDLEIEESINMHQLGEKNFDVVTLWHVLEHIHGLEENVKTYHNLLKANGKLIVAVPNHESYDAIHYKEFWAAYDVPRHIWHFSPKQMKQFSEKNGFRLIKIRTMPFDSFYVSILSEKYKNTKYPLIGGFLHGKISWIKSQLNAERCSSVIYVLEKI